MQDFKKRSIETSAGRRICETSQAYGGITARRNRRRFTSKTSQSQVPQCILLLKASRKQLESERAWTQGAFGRDVDGNAIGSTDPSCGELVC